MGNLKTNKTHLLFETESPVISLASNISGNAVLSGHLDGSVCRFYFNGSSQQQVCYTVFTSAKKNNSLYLGPYFHSQKPPFLLGVGFCLSWRESVCV